MDHSKQRELFEIKALIVMILIVLVFLLYYKYVVHVINPNFRLLGDSQIVINAGEEYKEPGYEAIFNKKDYTKQVKVESAVDTDQPGDYVITYTIELDYLRLRKTLERKVKVVDKTKPVITIDVKMRCMFQLILNI